MQFNVMGRGFSCYKVVYNIVHDGVRLVVCRDFFVVSTFSCVSTVDR